MIFCLRSSTSLQYSTGAAHMTFFVNTPPATAGSSATTSDRSAFLPAARREAYTPAGMHQEITGAVEPCVRHTNGTSPVLTCYASACGQTLARSSCLPLQIQDVFACRKPAFSPTTFLWPSPVALNPLAAQTPPSTFFQEPSGIRSGQAGIWNDSAAVDTVAWTLREPCRCPQDECAVSCLACCQIILFWVRNHHHMAYPLDSKLCRPECTMTPPTPCKVHICCWIPVELPWSLHS